MPPPKQHPEIQLLCLNCPLPACVERDPGCLVKQARARVEKEKQNAVARREAPAELAQRREVAVCG